MEFLDIFALIILVLMIVAVLYIWIWAAMFPGKIAKKRGHPQAEAINIAGWMGAIFGDGCCSRLRLPGRLPSPFWHQLT